MSSPLKRCVIKGLCMDRSRPVGVVTVTYNSAQFIDEFMTCMLAQTYEAFILYIIDNASSDDTLKRVAHYIDSRIVVITNQENIGVAAGNNQGIQASLEARCDEVLLINNDTEFGPKLIERLVMGLDAHHCHITVPKMIYYDKPNRIWCAGGQFNRWEAYAVVHYGMGELDQEKYNVACQVEYTPTCCMLIRKSVFETIGFMDEKYFVYFDDVDFCFRAMNAQLKMYYIPHAELRHKVSSSTGGEGSLFTIRYCTRNKVYFMKRNLKFFMLPIWLILYQGLFIIRLLFGKDSVNVFKLKQKSFWKGLML